MGCDRGRRIAAIQRPPGGRGFVRQGPPRSQAGLQWAAIRVASLAALLLVLVPAALGASTAWETRAPLPVPRTEVAAAALGGEIAVVGGFNLDGTASRRADAYSPTRDRWRRLPDLPVGAHHAMAVSAGGRLYVLGGYRASGVPPGSVHVLDRGRWRGARACPSRVPPPVRASRAAGSWSRAA